MHSPSCTLRSWLAYAKAAGNGKRVTSVNMTWPVPAFPTTRGGGNAPGWWWGFEPNPALYLLQPILAYGDGSPDYTIFNGEYDWPTSNWWMSDTITVLPGDIIKSSCSYEASDDMYTLVISNSNRTGATITSRRKGSKQLYTDVYVVVEHQPNSCSEYPADGGVIFSDISIAWDGQVSTNPQWTAQQFKPACNCKAAVISPSAIGFTWDTA